MTSLSEILSGAPDQPATPAAPAAPAVALSSSAPKSNSLASILESDPTESRVRQSATVVQASGVTPDQAAEAKKLAAKTGIPAVAVEATLPDVKKRAQVMDLVEAAKKDPAIAKLLSDPNVAKFAIDDVGALESVGNAVRNVGLSVYKGVGPGFAESFYGVLEAGTGAAEDALQGVTGSRRESIFGAAERAFGDLRKGMQSVNKRIDGTINAEGTIEKGVYGGIQSMAQMFPAAVLSALTRNPTPMLALGSVSSGGAAAGKGLDKGLSPAHALLYGAEDAAVEALTERIPAVKLIKDLGVGTPFVKTLFNQLVAEIPGEIAATVLQNFNEYVNINPDKPFSTYLQALPEDIAQTVVATVTMVGAQTSGLHAINRAMNRRDEKAAAAEDAKVKADGLNQIIEAAAASKTLQRDPESFKTFMGQVASQTGVENVFIPAEKLVEYYQSQGIDPFELDYFEQQDLASAIATGGDISIPLSAYVADIAPEHHAGLGQFVRLSEDSWTLEESDAWNASVDDIVAQEDEALRVQMDEDRKANDPAERVFRDVQSQLVAAGRTPDVAEKEAATQKAFFSSMAKRMGGDAWRLYEPERLNITREMGGVTVGKGLESLDLFVAEAKQHFKKQAANEAARNKRSVTDMLGMKKPAKEAATPRPLVNYLIGLGGIDPQGKVAAELAAMDITPKNTPRLFKSGGMRDLDNLVASEFNGAFSESDVFADEDGNGYIDRDYLLEMMRNETFGNFIRTPEQRRGEEQAARYAELRDLLTRNGLELETATNEEIKAAIEGEQGAVDAPIEPEAEPVAPEPVATPAEIEAAPVVTEDPLPPAEVAQEVEPEPAVEPEPEQEFAPEVEPEPIVTETRVEDFGEKISGAKKDLWTGYTDKLTDALPDDIRDITLAKHFPEPDYAAMIAAGSDTRVLATIKAMRDIIPAKPRKEWKLKSWAGNVKALREFSNDLLTGKQDVDVLLSKMKTTGGGLSGLRGLEEKIQLYIALGYPAFTKADGWSVSLATYSVYKGERFENGKTMWSASPTGSFGEAFDTKDQALDYVRAKLEVEPAAKERQTKLDIYQVTKTGEIIVGKKVGAGKFLDLKKGFTSVKDARAYLKENEASLLELLAKRKETPPERRSTNDPRQGEDYRMGENVSPERFANEFGFRGVQFGNYVEQPRRIADLNNAYDALLDMAAVIGVPSRAISLNGTLGLAFGARGSGGKNPAAAHYEPGQAVINLTKNSGAGSLGHEWWHALDNMFGKKSEGEYQTEMQPRKMNLDGTPFTAVRTEVGEAFKGVQDAIKRTDMVKRSKETDKTRSKDYWSTGRELTARAFEAYLIHKASLKGNANDYLANVVSPEVWDAMAGMENDSSYPYPTDYEMNATIAPAFDALFATLQTRETDAGVEFYQKVEPVTETQAFKDWFGDSKVVDADGKPLVVYHGTGESISVFDSYRSKEVAGYFTPDVSFAEDFANASADDLESNGAYNNEEYPDEEAGGASVIPVYLSVRNPWDYENEEHVNAIIEKLPEINRESLRGGEYETVEDDKTVRVMKELGFDGFYVREDSGANVKNIGVFSPTQIKSVNNRGTFDPQDPRILNQDKRGSFTPATNAMKLFEAANLTTFIHESGHYWLETFKKFSERAQRQLDMHADSVANDIPIGLLDADRVKNLQSVVDDFAAIMKHVGNTDPANITREQHEEFARTIEAYFMEGKAPSVELQSPMQRIKDWFIAVYKDARALRVNMTPEIRSVLDRMLATEEQIAEAQRAAQFEALTIEGATESEQATLNRLNEAATGEAERKLLVKMMAPIRREREAKYKEEWRKMADAVRAEMEQEPAWRALAMTRGSEGVEPVKLDRGMLEDKLGSGVTSLLPRGVTVKQGGIDPDIMAEELGLPDVYALADALATVKDVRLQDAVKTETDARMKDKYGDILNDGSIEEEAREAIHNQKRGDAIAMELRILRRMDAEKIARKTAERRIASEGAFDPQAYQSEAAVAETGMERLVAQETARVARFARAYDRGGRAQMAEADAGIDPKAIREAARRVVGKMKAKDLGKTAQYARAELKAAEQARKAVAKRDYEQASFFKYRQLLNHYLFIETKAAQAEADTIVKYLGRLADKKTIPTMDQDYLEQIHGLLEKFDMRRATQKEVERRKSFAAWVAEQEIVGREIAASDKLINLSQTTHYSGVPLDDLRGLRDTVKQIEHLGRLKQKLADLQEQRDYDELVTEATAQVDSLNTSIKASVNAQPERMDKVRSTLRGFDASLMKIEQIVDWLDGGNPNGIFNRVVFRRIADAQTLENDMSLKYAVGMEDITSRLDPKRMEEMIVVPGVNNADGSPLRWRRSTIMSVALNMGNAGNLSRMMHKNGNNLTPKQINDITSNLNAAEWKAVQEMWDLINQLWPQIEAMEKNLNGIAPPKVEPRAFTVDVDGQTLTMRGGYFPIVYDPTKSNAAAMHAEKADAKSLFENTYVRATTAKNHTKEREDAVGRALLFDLNVLPRHLSQVIHDIAFREAVMDVDRFMADGRVSGAVKGAFGQEVAALFRPWLQAIANDRNANPMRGDSWERFARGARTNATIVGLGFRLTTMMAQVSGLSASAEFLGAKWVAQGMRQFYGSPTQMAQTLQFVMEKSGEMRHRHNTMDRDIRDGMRALSREGLLDNARRFAFMGISIMDKGVAVPTWLGAYQKGLSENMGDAEAAAYADKAVRMTQGAGGAKDLAAVQRGSEFKKWLTMFYSYFNVLYNRQRDIGRSAGRAKSAGDFATILARSFWLVAVPAIASELLTGKGPEDDEDPALWAARKVTLYPLMSVPVVRDLVGGLDSGFGYQVSPMARSIGNIGRLAVDVKNIAEGDADAQSVAKNGLNVAGFIFGLPVGQVATTGGYIWDVIDGDARPDGVLDVMRGLAVGTPRK